MSLEKRPEQPPKSNDELLEMAEKFAEHARNNYGSRTNGNEYAQTAALISLAGSAIVITRMLIEQTQRMNETNLPDVSVLVEPPQGLEHE